MADDRAAVGRWKKERVKVVEATDTENGMAEVRSAAAVEHAVFLSYNRSDQPHWVSLLKQNLEPSYRTFFDDRNIGEADRPIDDVVLPALNKVRVVLACVGPEGFGNYQLRELDYALAREQREKNVSVLFVALGSWTYSDLKNYFSLVENAESLSPFSYLKKRIEEEVGGGGRLTFSYPKSFSGEAGLGRLKQWLFVHARKSSDAKPDGLEKLIKELVSDIYKNGLTIFLGNTWPDRYAPGALDVDLLARRLASGLKFDNTLGLSSDQWVSLGEICSATEKRSTQNNIRAIISEYSNAPESYQILSRAINEIRVSGKKSRFRKYISIIIVSESMDVFLERELARFGISFSSAFITYREEKPKLRWASFRISKELESNRFELQCDGGVPIYIDVDNIFENIDEPMYGSIRDRYHIASKLNAVSFVMKENEEVQVASALDDHIEECYKKLGKTEELESKESSRFFSDAMENGDILILKVRGCAYDPGISHVIGVDPFLELYQTMVSEKFPNQEIRESIHSFASIFCGFSLADTSMLSALSSTIVRYAAGKKAFIVAAGDDENPDTRLVIDRYISTNGSSTFGGVLENVDVVLRTDIDAFIGNLVKELTKR